MVGIQKLQQTFGLSTGASWWPLYSIRRANLRWNKIILLYNEEEHIKHSTKYQKLFMIMGNITVQADPKCLKEVML